MSKYDNNTKTSEFWNEVVERSPGASDGCPFGPIRHALYLWLLMLLAGSEDPDVRCGPDSRDEPQPSPPAITLEPPPLPTMPCAFTCDPPHLQPQRQSKVAPGPNHSQCCCTSLRSGCESVHPSVTRLLRQMMSGAVQVAVGPLREMRSERRYGAHPSEGDVGRQSSTLLT